MSNSYTVTFREIDGWLASLNEFEQNLKAYYTEHGECPPVSKIRNFLPAEPMTGYLPVDLLNVSLAPGAPNMKNDFAANPVFYEHDMFINGRDIYIQKQARYMPPSFQSHMFFEISYQYSGSCDLHIRHDNSEEIAVLEEGDIFFIAPGQKHAIRLNSDSTLINIGIRQSTFLKTFLNNLPLDSILGLFFTRLLNNEMGDRYNLLFHTASDDRIRDGFHRLAQAYCSLSPYSGMHTNLMLNEFFLLLLESKVNNIRYLSLDDQPQDKLLSQLIAYIEQNYRTVSASEVADHFSYSLNHVNHLLKASINSTAGELLTHLKMQRARQLLLFTELSVENISEDLGYKDTTNFIRNFKKYYSRTPLQYRLQGA